MSTVVFTMPGFVLICLKHVWNISRVLGRASNKMGKVEEEVRKDRGIDYSEQLEMINKIMRITIMVVRDKIISGVK